MIMAYDNYHIAEMSIPSIPTPDLHIEDFVLHIVGMCFAHQLSLMAMQFYLLLMSE